VSRIIFVTGTDTGVGKTLLTASLLLHLRRAGIEALAMKPFCSGGTGDVDLIQAIQGDPPAREDVNPFYFPEPVAPLVAARRARRRIQLSDVFDSIRGMARGCECLVVEGAGGLLVPLGEGFMVADLIAGLDCDVVVVTRNKLGTINHTLLTVEALHARGLQRLKVVLMGQASADASTRSNAAVLHESLSGIGVFTIPYLGSQRVSPGRVKRMLGKIKKTLAQIADPDSFAARASAGLRYQAAKRSD
jgi:dethiobiotin synthase